MGGDSDRNNLLNLGCLEDSCTSHYQHVQELAGLGSWCLDFDAERLYCSEELRTLVGVDGGEQGHSREKLHQQITPEDRTTVRRHWNELLDGAAFDVEYRLTDDDERRWVRERTAVDLDDDGNPVAATGVIQEITERKERERALDAARTRYRDLLDGAPDPIFVVDDETGQIVEANAAAANLRGQPREEIIGLHHTALHPEDDACRYAALFDDSDGTSGAVRSFDDESPLQLVTVDGDRVPISISVATVDHNGRTLVHETVREISTRQRYENALEGVNRTARDLLSAETDASIAATVVDTAMELLDAVASTVYLYDEWSGELVPSASAGRVESVLGDLPRFSPGEGLTWRVFAEQEPAHFDDVRTAADVYNARTPIRSEILIPLGEHGVLLIGDTTVGAFDELSVEIAETLGATAEAALGRAKRNQELREREREATAQITRLERLHDLNDEIRTILQKLVNARSHEPIVKQVCTSLASLDRFDYVWIGEPDLETSELTVGARAGTPERFLESLPLDLSGESTHPPARATRERTTVLESNVAATAAGERWREVTLLNGFQSVVSVPITHGDVLYGVLSVYCSHADQLDARTTAVLSELGELIGYALNAVDQRNALFGENPIDLVIDTTDEDDVLVNVASELSATFEIKNILLQSEEHYLVHLVIDGSERDWIQSIAKQLPAIEDVRPISDSDPALYELKLIGGCLATKAADLGAHLHVIDVSEDHYRLRVSLPNSYDERTFIDRLQTDYPDIQVVRQRSEDSRTSGSWRWLLTEALTERQQDILAMAYYSGYFDQPRDRTGADIATSLDISQPAFSTQLRAAQANLLQLLFETETA